MSTLLEKVVNATDVDGDGSGYLGDGGGGILNTQQANRFIDYMWDETVIAQDAQRIPMAAPTRDIDVVEVGKRLVQPATEHDGTYTNADPAFTKVSISTEKLRLDWELTSESLEDNIAGEDLEDHIARLMAQQFANDVEDLAINGDTASADTLLAVTDGYYKRARDNGHVVSHAGTIDRAAFNSAVKAMPRKYLQRRDQLRFYTSAGLVQDFLHSLGDRATALGDSVWFGNQGVDDKGDRATNIKPFGIPLKEVPLFREDEDGSYSGASGGHGHIELTFPDNRLWGVWRTVKVYREFKPKKDSIEYTVYTRQGFQVKNADSYVVVNDVQVQEA